MISVLGIDVFYCQFTDTTNLKQLLYLRGVSNFVELTFDFSFELQFCVV